MTQAELCARCVFKTFTHGDNSHILCPFKKCIYHVREVEKNSGQNNTVVY